MLIVREVYSDWATERRGTIRIRRADQAGCAPPPATDTAAAAKRYAVAGKLGGGAFEKWKLMIDYAQCQAWLEY